MLSSKTNVPRPELSESTWLLEALPDASFVVDEEGRIEFASRRANQLLGYEPGELLGELVEVLVPEPQRERHPGLRRMFMEEAESRPMGEQIALAARHKDGSRVPIDVSLSHVETSAGPRAIVLLRDLAARAAERALRGSSKVADACFKHMLTQLVVLDRDYNFVRVNDAYARACGRDVSEFPGQNHFEMYPSDTKALFDRVVASKKPFQTFARPFAFPDHPEWGVTYWDWTLVPILDADSEVEALVFALDDVTARVRVTEELRQKEAQLAEARQLESVGRLAGGVAHDFNNVLTAVSMAARLLAQDLAGDENALELLEDIIGGVDRASSLTQQLLAYSRKQVLHPKVVDLHAVVAKLEKTLRHVASDGVDLDIVTGTGKGLIEVDPTQLDQLLLNLAVNAVDAMPEGGRLHIVSTGLEVDPESAKEHNGLAPGQYVMVSVRDNGVGMDTTTRERIFEPFFTTKPIGKGTGLGLATVEGIVKQSGGEVFVVSEPGVGTVFKIYFPRTDAVLEEHDTVPDPIEPAERGAERILVVEDEPIILRLITAGLRRQGYEVSTAGSGEEALELLGECDDCPDLVLTDLLMPGMGGREFAEGLRQRAPTLPIICMSGLVGETGRAADLPPGVSFIAKPFSPEELGQLVRDILDQPVESRVAVRVVRA